MKLLNRVISAVILFIFATTNVVGAAPVWPSSPEIPISEKITVPPIRIPAEFASVEKTHGDFSPDRPAFIYIQDAHGNYDAQISTNNLLEYLTQYENIHIAFSEGVADSLNPNGLRFFPQQEINTDVADALAKKGEVTGLELFLLKNPDTMRAFGIEDIDLYGDNLRAFRRVLAAKPVTQIFFSTVRGEVDRISNHLLNRELREFVKKRESYRSAGRDLHLYLPILLALSKTTLNRDFSNPLHQLDWPQISRVAAIQSHTEQIDPEKLVLEVHKLQSDLEIAGLGKETIAEFVSFFDETALQTASAQNRRIRRVFEDVYSAALKGGFRLQNYPILSEAGARLILQSELDPEELAHEIDKLGQEIQDKLISNEDEQSVLDILDDIFLQELAITLSLETDSLNKFRERIGELQPGTMMERLKHLAGIAKLTLDRLDKLSAAAEKLDGFIDAVDQFYKGAEAREEVMVQRTLDMLKQTGETRAVLITGGFHSSRVAAALEESGASYMILSPRVSETDPARATYYQTILEGKSFERSHILSHPITQTGFNAIATRAGSDLSRPAATYLDTFAELAGIKGYTIDQLTSLDPGNESFIDPASYSAVTVVDDTDASVPVGVRFRYGRTYDRTVRLTPVTKVQETFVAAPDSLVSTAPRASFSLTPPLPEAQIAGISPVSSGFGASNAALGLANLIAQYEKLPASESLLITLDAEVDGEWIRSMIRVPAPKSADETAVIEEYLLSRIYNIFVVTGPSALEIYSPTEEIAVILDSAKKRLEENPNAYSVMLVAAKLFHDKKLGSEPVPIAIAFGQPPEGRRTKNGVQSQAAADSARLQDYLRSIQRLEGFAVGIDVGGSDVKLAVLAPGWDLPLTKENKWEVEPRHMKNGSEYLESLTLLTKFIVAAANLRQASAEQPELWRKVERVLNEKDTPFETLRSLTSEIEVLGISTFAPPQSVGISFPDVIANNEILYGLTSKMKGIRAKYDRDGNDSPEYRAEFNRDIRPLARLLGGRLAAEYSLSFPIPTAITNDGKIGSLWAAALLEEGGLLNFATGTSLGGGFVDANGEIASRIYELGYLSVFLFDQNPAHKHVTWDIHGVGQQLLSQDTIFNLAIEKKLMLNGKVIDTIPAERAKVLAQIQDILLPSSNAPESEKEKVRQIFSQVGEYLADIAIVTYYGAVKDTYNKIILFGRVMSGEGGDIAVKRARAILAERGISVGLLRASEVAQLRPESPMAQMDPDRLNRVAQSIGTIYLGNAERLKVRGFGAGGVITKKAPGTDQLTNMEENFYKRLSDDLDSAHAPEIIAVDAELKELIKAVLSVDNKRLDDLVAASKDKMSDVPEPTIFREQFLLLLEQGKIRFKVQDLSDKALIAKTANEFAKQNIVIDHLDERLYPRLHSTRNAMGAISFLTTEKYGDDYFAEIHISKALWEEIGKIGRSLDSPQKQVDASLPDGTQMLVRKMMAAGVTGSEYRSSFLNQIIIHEAIESLVGAAEQITPHRMAGILEMFFATKLAKSLGVSDINLWYLYNATPTYLRNLDIEYRIYGDPTLGNFYDALWQSARDRNMTQHLSRTEPLVHLRPLLTGSRLVKEAPSTPTAEVPEILALEEQYRTKGILIPALNKDFLAPAAKWIQAKKVGKVYDHLLDLIRQEYTGGGIVIKVDKGENGALENEVFYPRQDKAKSQPGILFFLTESVEAKTENIEIDEKRDGQKREVSTLRYFRKGPVELHITYGFWRNLQEMEKQENGKGVALLAQILVHAYIQNFLPPHMEGFTPHGWAGINTLHFATDKAKKEWLNDIDLFFLDHASATGNIRYFYDLLWQYRMTKDVQGNFIQAVYKRFEAIYNAKPELVVKEIKTDRDAVVFYTFLIDHHFANIPIADRPAKVAKELNLHRKSSPHLKLALDDDELFFKFKRVYVLQGPLSLLQRDNVKTRSELNLDAELSKDDQTRIDTLWNEIKKKKVERVALQKSKSNPVNAGDIGKIDTQIRKINNDIDELTRNIAEISSAPFAQWMVKQAYELMDTKGKKTIVLAVYGGPGTGKTVGTGILRDALAFTFKDIGNSGLLGGLWVNFFGVDQHLKPGSGYRYNKRSDNTRFTTISRPQIYDRGEILRILEGLADGQEILTPFDPDAPRMPEGTTFDEKTLDGKRSIFGSHLQILIIDLTVYGLDPHIMKYIDKVIPIVFDNERVRLERRLERDARPKPEGGSKGDTPKQVLGDFVEKQLVEGKMYEVPLIEDLAEQGPVDIWVQDTNKIVTITKPRHKTSSGFGTTPVKVRTPITMPQVKSPAAETMSVDISPAIREFPGMRHSPLVSGSGVLDVPSMYIAQFENPADFGISLAVAASADNRVDVRFDRGLSEFMLKALGINRDPTGDRFAEAAAETKSQIAYDAAPFVDRVRTSPTLLALLPNALGQDETLLYDKLAALDEGTVVILLGRHQVLEKAFAQVKRDFPLKRLQFRMVAPKDFGVVDGLTGPINVGKLYGKLLSLASEFNIPEASIGFLFDDENQLADQDKLRQFGLAVKMVGRELDRYIGGSAAAIEEISEALKLNYQLGDKASVVYNSFIQMQHGQPFHVFLMETLAEMRMQQLAERMSSTAA